MYLKAKRTKCPECGSALSIGSINEIARCTHCQTPVLIKIENYLPEYILRSTIKINDTTSILITRLKHPLIAEDFIASSRIISRSLYYIPFILTTGYRCGEHYIEEIDRVTEEKRPDTKVLMASFKKVDLAIRLESWGDLELIKERILDNKTHLEPLYITKIDGGTILRPDINSIKRQDLNLQFMTLNKNIRTEIICENSIIIYYPIIRVVIKYRNNIYHYTIDGITGDIIYGIAPEAEYNRFFPMALAAFFVALFTGGIGKFLLSTFVGGIFLMPLYILPIFMTFIIAVLVFIYIAYIFYRNYGEIVIRGDSIEINKMNIPETTFIERLLRPLFRIIEESVKSLRRRSS